MVAGPARYTHFPSWYSWVKWVLPLALTLASGIFMWGALSGWIGTFGYLDGAVSLVNGLEGFSAMAMKGTMSGFVASAVGVISSGMVRIGLFFVTEEIATHNLNRNAQLMSELEEAQNKLEEEKAHFNETLADLDKDKEEALAQYNQLLGRTRGTENRDKPRAPRKRTRAPEAIPEAANTETAPPVRAAGKRKARK